MPYNLAILGRGSAAAYYLSTVDLNQFPKIIVIGQDDPWDGQRGGNLEDLDDPANFVNQTAQMIAKYGDTVPAYSTDLYPRTAWAKSNNYVFDKCKVDLVKGQILKVRETKTPERYKTSLNKADKCFEVTVKRSHGEVEYHASKVVLATGASSHKTPPKLVEWARRYPDLFMDMDKFARDPSKRKGKRIIVQGPNAAVDTADTAQYNDCTVYWLVGRSAPAILATPHQVGARAVIDKSNTTGSRTIQIDQDKDPERIEVNGNEIKVKLTKEPSPIVVDSYVWGIGQDEKKALSFIDSALLNALEPIYDINQRHGEAWESVEGFQTKGTSREQGFEVIGALARQVIMNNKGLNHTYLSQLQEVIEDLQGNIAHYSGKIPDATMDALTKKVTDIVAQSPDITTLKSTLDGMRFTLNKDSFTWQKQTNALVALIINYAVAKLYFDKHGVAVTDDDLNNALKILTPSTVGSPQLGSIRTTTAAINGFMPKYVVSDVNFSHDDQSMLRVFIAASYPLVTEEEAQEVIRDVIGRRKQARGSAPATPGAKAMGPYGFTPDEVNEFKARLKVYNERRVGDLSTAKVVGTGQTVVTTS